MPRAFIDLFMSSPVDVKNELQPRRQSNDKFWYSNEIGLVSFVTAVQRHKCASEWYESEVRNQAAY